MTEVPAAVEKAALAAADRVGGGERLRADVLAGLYAPGREPDQFSELVDVAALIVSVATLGWTVFWNLRTKTDRPDPEVVARRIRVELPADGSVTPEQRDLVVDAVVRQILTEEAAAEHEDEDEDR
ncbi:hypothetical protein [Saccharothrix deserti]|uniref:hypothetical protein n=1 Tax=Saccharothrix deserti TaxID=2593674 RepID=UPI00131E096C|nr:hypothetical protein [Saccharothrix deserti]